jgi:hypothetical protein
MAASSIQRWTITGREEWLARRKPNINGSEIGALFGCSPFMTPYALYAEKAELAALPDIDNDAMRRGRIMEPAVAQAIREQHPDWSIVKADDYVWSPDWRLGCTPDFWISAPSTARHGVLQAKSVAKPIFDAEWQDGPPQWIVLQTLQEMMLADVSWGVIGALVLSTFTVDLKLFEFTRHAGAEAKMIAEAKRFWADVEAARPPKPDYAADGDVIKAIYARDDGPTLDLSRDNRMPELLDRHEQLAAMGRHAETEMKAIKAEIADKLGAAAAATVPGWQITNKLQHRKETVQKASSFRVLRIKRLQTQSEAA